MPFGAKPVCHMCKGTNSNRWHRDSERKTICNACHLKPNSSIKEEANGTLSENGSSGVGSTRTTRNSKGLLGGTQYLGPLRKSSRLKPSKHKYQSVAKPVATKGKSRRLIFKKNPIKAPTSVATIITSDYIFYNGIYWQVGDIVSVMDHDGGIFYAQIRGFLQDQFCVKSAVITWLLPTMSSPEEGFDAATYILGPEEDLPRTMDCFEFVCHAPSDYFKAKNSPYPTMPTKPELGYVWTNMGSHIQRIPTNEEVYGLKSVKDEENRKVPGTPKEKKERAKTDKTVKKKDASGKDKKETSVKKDSVKEKKTDGKKEKLLISKD